MTVVQITEEPLDDIVLYVVWAEFSKETFVWDAVKGFGEVKEHKKGYSLALNSLTYFIEYSKECRLCAVSFPVTSLARFERVVRF